MNKSMSVVRIFKLGRQLRSTSYEIHYNSNIALFVTQYSTWSQNSFSRIEFFIRENKSHTYHFSCKVWYCLSVRMKPSWQLFFLVMSMSFLIYSCMLHCLCRNIRVHVYLRLPFTKLSVYIYIYIPFTRFLIVPHSYYGLHKTSSINSTSIF
jgi:hypothetical protein